MLGGVKPFERNAPLTFGPPADYTEGGAASVEKLWTLMKIPVRSRGPVDAPVDSAADLWIRAVERNWHVPRTQLFARLLHLNGGLPASANLLFNASFFSLRIAGWK